MTSVRKLRKRNHRRQASKIAAINLAAAYAAARYRLRIERERRQRDFWRHVLRPHRQEFADRICALVASRPGDDVEVPA